LVTYAMPNEQDNLRRWRAGEPKPEGHNAGWKRTVQANVSAGKVMQRVKVVRRPFTEYTRFLFAWAIPGNVETGEDYRILDLTNRSLDIPKQDFWIFDESTVALLNFNPDGTLKGRELADPSEIEKYLRWRCLTLSESVPFRDYKPE
jgi:uncharacterized protein DUF6879